MTMQLFKKSTCLLPRLFTLLLALKSKLVHGKNDVDNIANLRPQRYHEKTVNHRRSLQSGPAYSPEQCAGFLSLNFEAHNYDEYDRYYDENSEMVMAQSGVYQGPKNIEEYVRFVGLASPYIDDKWAYNSTSNLVGFDPETGMCVFNVISTDAAVLNKNITKGGTLHYGIMIKLYYSIPKNNIYKNHVYYTPEFLSRAFQLLATDGVNEFVCNILTSPDGGCQDVNKLNGDMSKEECMNGMDKLPVAEGDLYHADGNSRACRIIHAVFAESNPDHCAHLSLAPAEDPKGNIKCQSSAYRNPTDMFTEEEILAFQQFCKEQPPLGTESCLVYEEENPESGASQGDSRFHVWSGVITCLLLWLS